jgi:hypothetical protein
MKIESKKTLILFFCEYKIHYYYWPAELEGTVDFNELSSAFSSFCPEKSKNKHKYQK